MSAPSPASTPWPDGFRAAASFTFDVDAESAVLGSAPHLADHVSLMSQQSYGPKEGVPRLLRLLARRGLQATFFVPGYTAERHPAIVERILEAGHEVAHHGYLHESLVGKTREEEAAILDRGLELFESRFGIRPAGYRAPFWELNWHTPELLVERGFRYDSTLMDADRPYRLRGGSGSLIELPINWGLDDWGQYCYIPGFSGDGGLTSPRTVAQMWRDDADAVADEGGLWILTNHPFLSGRPGRAAALETVIDHVLARGDVWVAPLGRIAEHAAALDLAPVALERSPLPEDTRNDEGDER